MPDSSSPQPHVPAETKGRHKTIAVVAGEWHLRALVRAAIENKRTSVVEALTLQDMSALAHDERLDLVILDADLAPDNTVPDYTSLFCDPVFAAIPLIVLTDRTARDVTALTGASQQVRTLYKHFSPFELLNIVYTLTGY